MCDDQNMFMQNYLREQLHRSDDTNLVCEICISDDRAGINLVREICRVFCACTTKKIKMECLRTLIKMCVVS